MAQHVLKTIAMATGVMATLLFTGFSSQTFAMSPFQASYQFSYNGKNMGSATRTLSKSGNNWSYVFAAKAGAIASATETSRFSLSGNNIISNSFSRSSKILVHNNTMSINFNPNTKTISTKKDDKARSFAWKAGVLDELNAELQLREDLKTSGLKPSYAIADAKEIEARRFVKQGSEKVKTSYGTFDTIKVVMKHDKPNRDTIFWLAPKLDYAPVKVSHQDGKTSYGLLLTGYKGSTN
ncbi:DUF3108 domain-containing protein [Acinetobacter albensis]|uniref:DUF3108 domain-containing protein n=1 Tax=Acinetobacter albensis TaxID=1673609 RepID=A0ABW9JNU0_9GAMM|nr:MULTISPECIES: DUF3108 domain-containing protein [Acinetobacter]MBE9399883.1 DUF3108 domain-containing protein [Acinetobacter albensis]QPF38334.1 DUF3108 domain-containing protein [Acinetobacter sp. TTH0-4]